jgi:NAD(P)-binding Rossmann-like domain
VSGDAKLETDYLVVGAGALGMAFVDALIDHSDADVVMVERRHRPGGHWLDAYPFVQLHQPSSFYGVSSTPLGHDRTEPADEDPTFGERATGTEICGYYDEIMRHRFLASGRVRFFPMSDYVGDARFVSRVTGRSTDVTVRTRVVDATYMASRIPATEPPPFDVVDEARCVPVGECPAGGYVIVGGGKTALDAICWLLDQGTEPGDVTWIRPQDTWVLNRAFFQPGRAKTFASVALQMEAMVASDTVDAVYEQLERDDVMLRVDRAVTPTMCKGGTVSIRELEQLRRVDDVVRLGHVERIEPDEIVLQHGSIPTSPDRLHVHCAAPGLSDNPPRPIFADDEITLQLVTRLGLTLSGALQGYLESTGRTTQEKNALCPPTTMPHTPFDYLRVILAGITTELGWQDAPDLAAWLEACRLNLLHGLGEHDDPGEVKDLQGRLFAALPGALEKLDQFAAAATPRERARMFAPPGGAA